MSDIFVLAAVIVVWFVLNYYILPKAGVET